MTVRAVALPLAFLVASCASISAYANPLPEHWTDGLTLGTMAINGPIEECKGGGSGGGNGGGNSGAVAATAAGTVPVTVGAER